MNEHPSSRLIFCQILIVVFVCMCLMVIWFDSSDTSERSLVIGHSVCGSECQSHSITECLNRVTVNEISIGGTTLNKNDTIFEKFTNKRAIKIYQMFSYSKKNFFRENSIQIRGLSDWLFYKTFTMNMT